MVRPWVVGVGRDDRRGGHGVKGGAGLRIGRERRDVGGVLRAVGAGGGGSVVSALIHAVIQQIKLGLEGKGNRGRRKGGGEKIRQAVSRRGDHSSLFSQTSPGVSLQAA